jgi:hypothetical protein
LTKTNGTVNINGNWYGATVSGTITPVGSSAYDSADYANAAAQLTQLKADITTVTAGLTPTTFTGAANYTFTPRYYTGGAISFSNKTITFNAQGMLQPSFLLSPHPWLFHRALFHLPIVQVQQIFFG